MIAWPVRVVIKNKTHYLPTMWPRPRAKTTVTAHTGLLQGLRDMDQQRRAGTTAAHIKRVGEGDDRACGKLWQENQQENQKSSTNKKIKE